MNALLNDFSGFGNSETRNLMERIYEQYFRKLDEKESLRRRLQMKQQSKEEQKMKT